MTPTLFIVRDGPLVEAPAYGRVDRLEKIHLTWGVMGALRSLHEAGYRLVMLATAEERGASEPGMRTPQEFIRALFASQGINFESVRILQESKEAPVREDSDPSLVDHYVGGNSLDLKRSAVIGYQGVGSDLAHRLGVSHFDVARGTDALTSWSEIRRALALRERTASVERTTSETRIRARVSLNCEAPIAVSTGIGFFDHMLEQIARHGGFALSLTCQGDLKVDEHHTVEDCALALGQALKETMGSKHGMGRYGFVLAMDEAEAQVALDLSGRAFFVWNGTFARERIGSLPTELVPHFFRSLADALGATLHLSVSGENTHHMVESCFKGVGRALRQALRIEGRELPTTKGVL